MDPFYLLGAVVTANAVLVAVVGLVGLAKPDSAEVSRSLTILCWCLLALSLVVVAVYAQELVSASLSDSLYERSQLRYRLTGPHAWVFWLGFVGCAAPQAFWFGPVRRRPVAVVVVALVTLGNPAWRWIERSVCAPRTAGSRIAATSLACLHDTRSDAH